LAISYKFPLCPQYRIRVQDIEQGLADDGRLKYYRIGRAEQVFNILNKMPRLRKYSPLVCKFLDKVTEFFHACPAAPRRSAYLLEGLGFRDRTRAAIGLPIALTPLQPALIHVCKGKE